MSHELEPQTRQIHESALNLFRNNPIATGAAIVAAALTPGFADRASAQEGTSGAAPVTATQTIDGKETAAFPGDPRALGYEAAHFADCWESEGHTSYFVKKVEPASSSPANKATLTVDRKSLASCDGYISREISSVKLKTKIAGADSWKTSKVPLDSVTTNSGKKNLKLSPLDYGQKLPKGKSMKVKVLATTEVTNMTANSQLAELGEKSAQTKTISTVFKIRR